eukprot:scaffold69196_cov22-Tisochrysis_lutea.AAC.1
MSVSRQVYICLLAELCKAHMKSIRLSACQASMLPSCTIGRVIVQASMHLSLTPLARKDKALPGGYPLFHEPGRSL